MENVDLLLESIDKRFEGNQIGDENEELGIEEGEQICLLGKPVHTVLLYGTEINEPEYQKGIFITAFGQDNNGEVYSAKKDPKVFKRGILWSHDYESRKGMPVELTRIPIDGQFHSLRIRIIDPEKGIIGILKKRAEFARTPAADRKKYSKEEISAPSRNEPCGQSGSQEKTVQLADVHGT
jgi:hypothetical protein